MNVREQIIAKTYWNNGELLPKCFSMQLLACLDTFAEPRRVVIAVRTKWTQCCFVGGQDVDGLESTLATCPAFGTNMSQTRSFTTRLYHLFQKAFAQIFAPTLWLLLKLILASQEPFLATLKQFLLSLMQLQVLSTQSGDSKAWKWEQKHHKKCRHGHFYHWDVQSCHFSSWKLRQW